MRFTVYVLGVTDNRRADADVCNRFVFFAAERSFCCVDSVARDDEMRREDLVYSRQAERSSEPLSLAHRQRNAEFSAEKIICPFDLAFFEKPTYRRGAYHGSVAAFHGVDDRCLRPETLKSFFKLGRRSLSSLSEAEIVSADGAADVAAFI